MEEELASARQRISDLESELAASEEKNSALEKKCQVLTAKNYQLEEECDLLAVELSRLKSCSGSETLVKPCDSNSSGVDNAFAHLSIDGSGNYAAKETMRIDAVCGAVNPLCAAFTSQVGSGEVAVVGGADKKIKVIRISDATVLRTFTCSSPIISMDAFDGRVLFGGMDGSIGVVRGLSYSDEVLIRCR